MLSAVGVSLTILFLASPSGANARPTPRSTNSSADRGAMTAYRTYLQVLVTGAPAASARVGQVITGVTSACPNALVDLTKLSAGQVSQSALTAFGKEVDADLSLAYGAQNAAVLNRLGGALDALSWSTLTPSATTMQFIGAERALAAIAAPSLCKDAAALDAAPLSEPPSTQRFLARYGVVSRTLNTARTAFQALLAQYETASESMLVAQINALAAQYVSQASTNEQTDASTTLSVLGISS